MKTADVYDANSWDFESVWKFTAGTDYPQFITAPGTPANPAAVPGNGQLSVNWTASSRASGYNVYIGTASGVYGAPVSVTGTSTVITGLTNGTKYYVAVKALHMAEEGAASVEISAVPHIPVNDLAAVPNTGRVDLAFTAPAGADTVVLQQSVDGGGTYSPAAGISLTGVSTTAAVTGLTNGTTYTYRLQLVYAGSEYFSNVVSVNAGNPSNKLSALSVTGCTLAETFSVDTYSYSSTVPSGVSSISVTATVMNSLSSLKIDGSAQTSAVARNVSLGYGLNNIVITVTAENGISQNYTISVLRILPASSVTINADTCMDRWGGGSIIYTGSYQGEAELAAMKFNLSGYTKAPTTTVLRFYVDLGNSFGSVTAFDIYGSNDDSWTTGLPAVWDASPLFTNINGLGEGWVSYDISEYVINHFENVDKIITIYLPGILTAGDDYYGISSMDSVNKPNLILIFESSDARLYDIKVGGTSIAGFSSDTYTYNYSAPHDTNLSALAFTSSVLDAGASQGIWAYDSVNKKWSVPVTAEDGSTAAYTVYVSAAGSSDATLSSISVNGTALSGFSGSTLNYTYNVAHGFDASTLLLSSVVNDHMGAQSAWSYDAGTGKWSVTVTAEDTTTQKTYTVAINELPSTDATLKSIKIGGTDLNGFVPSILDYTYDVVHGFDASTLVLSSVVNDHMGAQSAWSYDAGTGKWSVTVTAEDTTTQKTYTVAINELPSTDATLKSIKIGGTDLTGFAPSTLDYTYDVVHGFDASTLVLSSVVNDHMGALSAWSYDAGTGKWSVTVTAEDTTTQKTYTVAINELPSTDAALKSIKIGGIDLAGFAPSILDYTYDVVHGSDASTLLLSSVVNDHMGTQSAWSYDAGTGKWSVTVTAEDTTTQKTYTVAINELPSTDASLKSIKIGGTDLTGFAPSTLDYTCDVVHGFDASTLLLSSVVNDHMGTQSAWSYDAGTGKWSVTVTAEDTTTQKTYTVAINELPSTDAVLKSIKIGGTDLTGFAPSILDYTYDVVHGFDASTLVLTSEANDHMAAQGAWSYDAVTGKWSITVTAEDTAIQITYSVTVNELPSTDAELKSISIDGMDLDGFASSTLDYTYDMTHGTDASALAFTSEVNDHMAGQSAWSYDAGAGKWSVTVTAEDATTQKTYTVTVSELPSTDATLKIIAIEGIELDGFSPSILDYSYDVPHEYDASTLVLTSEVNDHMAAQGNWKYNTFQGIWSITVTAEDSAEQKTYTVTINELPSTNASLKTIMIGGINLSSFTSSIMNYTYNVGYGFDKSTLVLSSETQETGSTQSSWTYDAAESKWSVTVTAEDGITVKTYTVTIIAADSPAPTTTPVPTKTPTGTPAPTKTPTGTPAPGAEDPAEPTAVPTGTPAQEPTKVPEAATDVTPAVTPGAAAESTTSPTPIPGSLTISPKAGGLSRTAATILWIFIILAVAGSVGAWYILIFKKRRNKSNR